MFTGKAKCIDDAGSSFVETGRIYDFVDGLLIDNPGDDEPYNEGEPVNSIEEFNANSIPQFEAIV